MYPTNAHLLIALLSTPAIQAHYIFNQIVLNGANVGQEYTYTRKNTNSYQPSYTSEVIDSTDAICNKGANTLSSETLAVEAGDQVGFKLAFNELIEHPGPGFIYMSKAPGDVNSYTGDGDWFKVWESGVNGPASENTNWGTWQKPSMDFTIPADLPDGEYLVRPEHIAIHEAHVGKAQFYMECTQLSVSGGGSGTPSPLVKIPGLYSADDPGIAYNIWTSNPEPYVMPGPAVWGGGGGGGSSDSTSASGGASAEGPSTDTTGTGSESASGSSGASTGAESVAPVAGSGAAPSASAGSAAGSAAGATGQGATGSSMGGMAGGSNSGWPGASSGSSGTGSSTGSGMIGGAMPQANANSASAPAAGSAAQGGWTGAWNSRIKGRWASK